MSRIQVTLDANKLKGLSKKRTFNTQDGEKTVMEITFDLVPVKEQKVLKSTDKYDFVKTHFAAAPQTKDQRDAGEPTVFLGDGFTTIWKNDNQSNNSTVTDAKVVEDEDPFK